jgi:hypothetical protein
MSNLYFCHYCNTGYLAGEVHDCQQARAMMAMKRQAEQDANIGSSRNARRLRKKLSKRAHNRD